MYTYLAYSHNCSLLANLFHSEFRWCLSSRAGDSASRWWRRWANLTVWYWTMELWTVFYNIKSYLKSVYNCWGGWKKLQASVHFSVTTKTMNSIGSEFFVIILRWGCTCGDQQEQFYLWLLRAGTGFKLESKCTLKLYIQINKSKGKFYPQQND